MDTTEKLAIALRAMLDAQAQPAQWIAAIEALAEYDAQENYSIERRAAPADCDPTLSCTYEEFNRATAEFCKAAPTCNREQLENGRKALALMYLGMRASSPSEVQLAVGRLEFGLRRYMERDFQLVCAGE